MTIPTAKIQQDFDRIAEFSGEEWTHNAHYETFLLKHLPLNSDLDALEIGCWTGSFTRRLARRYRSVLALDLSPRMIAIARERSQSYSNIEYRVADVLAEDFSPGQFGCIAAIAILHHLPLEGMLAKMKAALAPEGTVLVLDLYKASSLVDYAVCGAAIPVNILLKLLKNGSVGQSAEARAAWQEHGRADTYATLPQIRRACAAILPGAKVTRHLLWRYSIVWPGGETC